MRDARPDFTLAVEALLTHAVGAVPEFAHVRATTLMVVAGAALGRSRASIRGFGALSPRVLLDGRVRRYEITLRPLFFLNANAPGRLATLFHELFHVGQPEGELDSTRGHGTGRAPFEAEVERLAAGYAKTAPPSVLSPLGHHGEVLCRQWRVRPQGTEKARVFTEKHVFVGPVPMRTPVGQRSVWW